MKTAGKILRTLLNVWRLAKINFPSLCTNIYFNVGLQNFMIMILMQTNPVNNDEKFAKNC